MVYRSSHSQNHKFNNWPRMWYYEKVLKIIVKQDFCYAHAGSVIHKVLEIWYNKDTNSIQQLKEKFTQLWLNYHLELSKIFHTKDEYWLMVLNGIDLKLNMAFTEYRIEYEDFLSFIDNFEMNDTISDWKSSKRRKENEEEYISQQKEYSWMFFRKFNRLPKLCKVYYLRYKGDKGVLEYTPTMEDIKQVEKQVHDNNKKMEYYATVKKLPERCDSCNFFCPYKEYCMGDINTNDISTTQQKLKNGQTTLIELNQAKKPIKNLTKPLIKDLNYKLHILENGNIKLDGPLHIILNKQLHKKFSYYYPYTYYNIVKGKKIRIDKTYKYDFWNEYYKTLPLGFLKSFTKTLNDYVKFRKCGTVKIIDHRTIINSKVKVPDKLLTGKILRDYQIDAVETFLKEKIGVLQLGTGAGKTLIATEIIRRTGYMTLFIIDKIELLRQTKKVFEDNLGIKIGQIGAGVNDFQEVTVATIQTLAKDPMKYRTVLNCARLVIFDECHKIPCDSCIKIANNLINTDYRLGISGTARRDDSHDMKITSVAGDIIFNMSSKQLIDKGWLIKPTIYFIDEILSNDDINKLNDKLKIGLINESLEYNPAYKEFIMNDKRNLVIKSVADKYNNKKVLILVKFIKHGEILNELIPNSEFLHGSTPKKIREQMFNDFSIGDNNILISTINIFAEGVDIPNLNVVINATANTGNIKTVQLLGRVLRILNGKKNALYIDFIDSGPFFKAGSYKRISHLKKEGHLIQQISFEDLIKIGGEQ